MTTTNSTPPGSFGLPLLGETLAWAGDPFGFMEKRFQEHGPVFKTKLFGSPTVCFVGEEGWRTFLDPKLITRQDASPPHISELVGNKTLPFVDGSEHASNKRILLQAFKPEPMRGYVPTMIPVFDRYFDAWAKKGSLSVYPEIERMTLVMFNVLFAGLSPEQEYPEYQTQLSTFMAGILALPLPIPWGAYQKGLRSRDWLVSYLLKIVRERRAKPGTDAISYMVAAKGGEGESMRDEQIAAELVHVYFAGYGGMSAFYGYALITLAKHPEIREKLLAELKEKTSEQPSFDELLKLSYMSQFFKELMRFYPIVPQTFFGKVIAPIDIAGYHIPVGWRATGVVGASLYDGQRFASPETFDPDRFGAERSEEKPGTDTFVPQGGGAPEGHRCLGESLSELSMKVFLARLLPRYEWELCEEPNLKRTFPASPKGGMPIRFSTKD